MACLLFPRISASAAPPSFPGHPSDLPQAQQSISLIPNGISPHVPDRPGVGSLGNRVILTPNHSSHALPVERAVAAGQPRQVCDAGRLSGFGFCTHCPTLLHYHIAVPFTTGKTA